MTAAVPPSPEPGRPPEIPPAPARDVWRCAAGCDSNDLAAWQRAFAAQAQARGFVAEGLGHCLGHALWLWQRPAARPGAPRLLIASGLHGNEAAGPWGLLAWLQAADSAALDGAALTLLPLVAPTGFTAATRLNALGQNPNRGFGRHRGEHLPSAEGELLLRHADRLSAAARDGVLACHEDLTRPHTYVYSFEPGHEPGAFSRQLLQAGMPYFALPPDGPIDAGVARGGLIHNLFDGSFESWLTECGAAVAACIETPGRADFARRVAAQAAYVAAFVRLRSAAAATQAGELRVAP